MIRKIRCYAVAKKSIKYQKHVVLGRFREHQKQWFQARASYFQAIALDASDAKIHFRCGQISERHNELRDAMSHYRVAIQLRPRKAKYYSRLGLVLEKMRLWEDAVHCHAIAAILDRGHAKHQKRLLRARTSMSIVREYRLISANHLSALHNGAKVTSQDLSVTGVYSMKCRLHEIEIGSAPRRIFEKLIRPSHAAYALREIIANKELSALDTPSSLHYPSLVSYLMEDDGVRAMFFEYIDANPCAKIDQKSSEQTSKQPGSKLVADFPHLELEQLQRLIDPLIALVLTDTRQLNAAWLTNFKKAPDIRNEDDDQEGQPLFGNVYRRNLSRTFENMCAFNAMEHFIVDNAKRRGQDKLVTNFITELGKCLLPHLTQLAPVSRALSAALCHGDLKPDNVVFDSDGRAVFIDWQYLSLLPVGFDLARYSVWAGLDWHLLEPVAWRFADQLKNRFDPHQVIWSVCLCYVIDALASRPGWVQDTHRSTVRPALRALDVISASIAKT